MSQDLKVFFKIPHDPDFFLFFPSFRLNNSESNSKKEVKDNYVNLMRPLTMVDTLDDIQSDESGINMSFNNPLFNEKEVLN